MDTRSSNVPRDPFHSIRTILYITACILAAIGFLILLRSVGNAAFLKGTFQNPAHSPVSSCKTSFQKTYIRRMPVKCYAFDIEDLP